MSLLFALCFLGADCSTTEFPAALGAAGVNRSAVVDASAAHRVRGQSMPFQFQQSLTWSMLGTATGTNSLSEGLVGSFVHEGLFSGTHSQTAIATQGTFAGLSGAVGVNGNPETGPLGLQFDLAGKALQQTINFGGTFGQTFGQKFGR